MKYILKEFEKIFFCEKDLYSKKPTAVDRLSYCQGRKPLVQFYIEYLSFVETL